MLSLCKPCSCLLIAVALVASARAQSSNCESSCYLTNGGVGEDCFGVSFEVESSECENWTFGSNVTNSTENKLKLSTYTQELEDSFAVGLNVSLAPLKWSYLHLQYKEALNDTEVWCHVFNSSSSKAKELFHNCMWAGVDGGKEMELLYQAYNSESEPVETGRYIFFLPQPDKIDLQRTPLSDWEMFLYVDVSNISGVVIKWQAPPVHFSVQYYLLQVLSVDKFSKVQTLESHRILSNSVDGEESFTFKTESLVGKIYFTIQILHDDCSENKCAISKSPIFILVNQTKSPVIVSLFALFVLLPAFVYMVYSWRRFGVLPPHKAPAVLIIYNRTMDAHFKAVVALAMYLRSACHMRALLEDLDILSAQSQDPETWYRDAISRVDAVLVVSSPACPGGTCSSNGGPVAALRLLWEHLQSGTRTPRALAVQLPYCSVNDLPPEARLLPLYQLPRDINELLWAARFGPRRTAWARAEFALFQSQIAGGCCDLETRGQFLTAALQTAGVELDRARSA